MFSLALLISTAFAAQELGYHAHLEVMGNGQVNVVQEHANGEWSRGTADDSADGAVPYGEVDPLAQAMRGNNRRPVATDHSTALANRTLAKDTNVRPRSPTKSRSAKKLVPSQETQSQAAKPVQMWENTIFSSSKYGIHANPKIERNFWVRFNFQISQVNPNADEITVMVELHQPKPMKRVILNFNYLRDTNQLLGRNLQTGQLPDAFFSIDKRHQTSWAKRFVAKADRTDQKFAGGRWIYPSSHEAEVELQYWGAIQNFFSRAILEVSPSLDGGTASKLQSVFQEPPVFNIGTYFFNDLDFESFVQHNDIRIGEKVMPKRLVRDKKMYFLIWTALEQKKDVSVVERDLFSGGPDWSCEIRVTERELSRDCGSGRGTGYGLEGWKGAFLVHTLGS